MKFSLALAALLAASPALAEGGIDFKSMPEGCEWQLSHSDGQRWRQTFVGKVKGKYRIEARDAKTGKMVNTTDYNQDGLLVRRTGARGARETFNPFSCYTVPGDCSYVYTSADGTKLTIESTVARSGDGFTSAAKPKGGAPYPEEQFKLGPYGLLAETKSQRYWTKAGHFKNCGLSS